MQSSKNQKKEVNKEKGRKRVEKNKEAVIQNQPKSNSPNPGPKIEPNYKEQLK